MKKTVIHLKGNSKSGYTVSMEFEKEIVSTKNSNASAEAIEIMLQQQETIARKLFDKEFPEAIAI